MTDLDDFELQFRRIKTAERGVALRTLGHSTQSQTDETEGPDFELKPKRRPTLDELSEATVQLFMGYYQEKGVTFSGGTTLGLCRYVRAILNEKLLDTGMIHADVQPAEKALQTYTVTLGERIKTGPADIKSTIKDNAFRNLSFLIEETVKESKKAQGR